MPVTLANMAAKVASMSMSWEGETLHIAYFPGKFTDSMLISIDGNTEQLNEVLIAVIQSWDLLLEPGGDPIPLDKEHLDQVPYPLKLHIGYAIAVDIRPNYSTLQVSRTKN